MQQQARPSHQNNLDLIRTLLALGVLVFHCRLSAGSPGIQFPWVPAFIAISGYLITESVGRSQGYAHFAVKRVLRVGPGFLVSLVLVAVLGGDVLATLMNWASAGMMVTGSNLPVWSLGLEEMLYALLALSFALGLFRNFRRGLVFLGLAYVTLLASSILASSGEFFLILRASLAFICGSALFLLRDRVRWSVPAALACLALAVYLRNWAPMNSWRSMILTGPALAYGLIALGLYARPIVSDYKGRLGDPSFGIYLYHWPIMKALQEAGVEASMLLLPTLALTVPLAFASWHLIEKPALGFKDVLKGKPDPLSSTARALG